MLSGQQFMCSLNEIHNYVSLLVQFPTLFTHAIIPKLHSKARDCIIKTRRTVAKKKARRKFSCANIVQ